MYPIKFKPIIKKMLWGSESWEVTCRPHEMGVIENGELAGTSFADFIAADRAAVLGIFCGEKFPLLVKTIDARDVLSVQVHPNDGYARQKGETDTGKTELWYVLTPPTDGQLIVGLKKGVTREGLAEAYKNGTVEQNLNRAAVKTGDIINIPAGLIHALTPGVRVVEIQQNSDITYRLYDFGRVGVDGKPRPLHVEDALAVTAYDGIEDDSHFTVEKLTITSASTKTSNPLIFSIYTCVEGTAIFETATHAVPVEETRSVFIPAGLGKYVIRPQATAKSMKNRPDGAAAKNSVFRGFAATGGSDFELFRYKGENVTLLKSEPIVAL